MLQLRLTLTTLATALILAVAAPPTQAAPTADPVTSPAVIDSAGVDPGNLPALTTLAPATRPAGATRATPLRQATYDVAILALDTPACPSPASAANAANLVSHLDAGYADQTGGRYRFRLSMFAAGSTGRAVTDLYIALADAPAYRHTPSFGAVAVIPVVVTCFQPGTSYAGLGYVGAAGIHANGYWEADNATTVTILAHEIGHNLGLLHSSAVPATPGNNPWPAGASPTLSEYGDRYDTMGNYMALSAAPAVRLSNYELDFLAALPDDRIILGVPSGSATTTLSAKSAQSGVTLLELPWLDRRKISVEYRPAIGADTGLDGWCAAWCTPGAGSGVVVRIDDLSSDAGPAPYDLPGGANQILLPAYHANSQAAGLRAGESLTTPDGTTIRLLAADSTTATVQVDRPADTTGPQVSLDLAGCPTATTCQLTASSGQVTLPAAVGTDINDRTTSPATIPTATMNLQLAPGTWQVRGYATDLAGNTTYTQATTVTVAAPPPNPGNQTGGGSTGSGTGSTGAPGSGGQSSGTWSWSWSASTSSSAGNTDGATASGTDAGDQPTRITGFSTRRSTTRRGRTIRDTIGVTPAEDRLVLLQRLIGGDWVTVTQLNTDWFGDLTLRIRVPKGRSHWRVHVPADPEQGAAATSAARTIRGR